MKFSFFVAFLALCGPIWAQSPRDSDYETLKINLNAARCDSQYELTRAGRATLGKSVEICGTVRGIFGSGDGFSLLLSLSDGNAQRIDAPAAFRNASALRVGSFARLLCRIEGTTTDEIMVRLLAATATQDAEFETAVAPRVGIRGGSPTRAWNQQSSDLVVIGPEIDLPAPPRSVAKAPARGVLGSRALPVPRAAIQRTQTDEINFYAALARQNNPRLSVQSANFIGASLVDAAATHGIDARFLAAIVQVESRFNPGAISSAGARGLGQLMPFNWAPLGVQNPFDARQNLHGAAKLLRINLNTYARDSNSTMLAVAAYHAGVGAVNRAGKNIPKASTHKYVWKVYGAYKALAPELFR